jgi:hypothetical protein
LLWGFLSAFIFGGVCSLLKEWSGDDLALGLILVIQLLHTHDQGRHILPRVVAVSVGLRRGV